MHLTFQNCLHDQEPAAQSPWPGASHLVSVKGAEDSLDIERLLSRGARNAKDPLELVQVQGAAWTFLHKENTELLDLGQVHLLAAAPLLAHDSRSLMVAWLLLLRTETRSQMATKVAASQVD